jgi:cell division protein ZapA
MPDKSATIQVEIFGQTYRVTAGTEPGYVEQLAKHVDGEMRAIGKQSGAVDSLRVAVLAALNIADECFQLRAQQGEATAKLHKRAGRLAEELQTALGEG